MNIIVLASGLGLISDGSTLIAESSLDNSAVGLLGESLCRSRALSEY